MQAVDDVQIAEASADLTLLLEAAEEAGRIAMRYFKNDPEVWMKGGMSPVSEADYAVDTFLRETLMAARPGYGWLSEETVDGAARLAAPRTFVVDPIDGTRGFLAGDSRWCVSVAVVENGIPISGVLECPAQRQTFQAALGRGAFRNGDLLSAPGARDQMAIGGPKEFIDALPRKWREGARRAAHIPSLAYRIAMVADGTLGASFVKPNAHDWDLAAADLILREAGGGLLGAQGSEPRYAGQDIRHGALVAGHGDLLAEMTAIIGQRFG